MVSCFQYFPLERQPSHFDSHGPLYFPTPSPHTTQRLTWDMVSDIERVKYFPDRSCDAWHVWHDPSCYITKHITQLKHHIHSVYVFHNWILIKNVHSRLAYAYEICNSYVHMYVFTFCSVEKNVINCTFIFFVKLRVRVRVKVKRQTSKLDPEVGFVMGWPTTTHPPLNLFWDENC